jgi:hypothetical protein
VKRPLFDFVKSAFTAGAALPEIGVGRKYEFTAQTQTSPGHSHVPPMPLHLAPGKGGKSLWSSTAPIPSLVIWMLEIFSSWNIN